MSPGIPQLRGRRPRGETAPGRRNVNRPHSVFPAFLPAGPRNADAPTLSSPRRRRTRDRPPLRAGLNGSSPRKRGTRYGAPDGSYAIAVFPTHVPAERRTPVTPTVSSPRRRGTRSASGRLIMPGRRPDSSGVPNERKDRFVAGHCNPALPPRSLRAPRPRGVSAP